MDSLIVFVARYLIWIMVAGFAAVWLFAENRRGKVVLGASAAAGLVIVLILILIAGKLYDDPRPFVGTTLPNLLNHAPDNGFPSDHSSAAGLIAVVVAMRHRLYGLLLGVAAIVVAWSRVAANAHHTLDVVTGLALGVVAAIAGTLLVTWILRRTRLLEAGPIKRLLEPGAPPA